MTFEEFFKKKRIDLVALEKGEPALFSEFKTHYNQMGEKSFDHTKKYWFNKIRRQYQLAAEIKIEKPKIENQLAEQTVIEAIIDEGRSATSPAPKLGFVPKFKAANIPKPVMEDKPEAINPAETPAPKLGFVPKFKAANIPKPVTEDKPEAINPPETPAPKLGFVPKFKAANMPKPAAENTPETVEPDKDISTDASSETEAPKLAYKPRFNIKNIPPKSPEE
jgi:hypothetical protein